jgi:acyl-coenzyme A thioesterase PaaI-like protein
MVSFDPKDENFETRVRASFARQTAMATVGIEIVGLKAGEIEFKMPHDPAYTQQHCFIHAGIITTALDTACGYGAFSLMPRRAFSPTSDHGSALPSSRLQRLIQKWDR